MTQLYSLYNNESERHLYKVKKDADGKCIVPSGRAECGRDIKAVKGTAVFLCRDENAAREACAAIGRSVCGNCVATLYATY